MVCKEQFQAAYEKIKEVNHIVRTLAADIEQEQARVQAERHQHHVKYSGSKKCPNVCLFLKD